MQSASIAGLPFFFFQLDTREGHGLLLGISLGAATPVTSAPGSSLSFSGGGSIDPWFHWLGAASFANQSAHLLPFLHTCLKLHDHSFLFQHSDLLHYVMIWWCFLRYLNQAHPCFGVWFNNHFPVSFLQASCRSLRIAHNSARILLAVPSPTEKPPSQWPASSLIIPRSGAGGISRQRGIPTQNPLKAATIWCSIPAWASFQFHLRVLALLALPIAIVQYEKFLIVDLPSAVALPDFSKQALSNHNPL